MAKQLQVGYWCVVEGLGRCQIIRIVEHFFGENDDIVVWDSARRKEVWVKRREVH